MSLSNFRLSPDQSDNDVVRILADEGAVRAIAQVARSVIEDAFPNADYARERLALMERNLEVLAPIIRAKFDAGDYTDKGDNKWIGIGPGDLDRRKLR